jgi:hypothetical protein
MSICTKLLVETSFSCRSLALLGEFFGEYIPLSFLSIGFNADFASARVSTLFLEELAFAF